MVVLNGTEYTNVMFRGLGYKDLFPEPVFTDMLAELEDYLSDFDDLSTLTEGYKDAAAASAVSAAASALAAAAAASALQATSTTSMTIGSGAKSATIQTGKSLIPGMPMRIARTSAPSTDWMVAITDTYDSGTGAWTGTVGSTGNNDYAGGPGPYTDWTFSFAGWEGPAGANGQDAFLPPEIITTGTTTPSAGLTAGVSYICDVSGGHVIIDLANAPPGLKIAHVQDGTIGDNNMVKVKPPAGKKIYNQTADVIITRSTQFDKWEMLKDTNGNYN